MVSSKFSTRQAGANAYHTHMSALACKDCLWRRREVARGNFPRATSQNNIPRSSESAYGLGVSDCSSSSDFQLLVSSHTHFLNTMPSLLTYFPFLFITMADPRLGRLGPQGLIDSQLPPTVSKSATARMISKQSKRLWPQKWTIMKTRLRDWRTKEEIQDKLAVEPGASV